MWHNYVLLNDDYAKDTGTGFEVHGLWSYLLEWKWKWFLNYHCMPCLYGPGLLFGFICLSFGFLCPVIALLLVNWYFKLAPNLKRIVSFCFIFNIYEFMQNFSAACIIFPGILWLSFIMCCNIFIFVVYKYFLRDFLMLLCGQLFFFITSFS